jgi:hypothetical protein
MVLAAVGIVLLAPPGRAQLFVNYGYGGLTSPFVATNFGTGAFASPFLATNFGTGAFASPFLATNFGTGAFASPFLATNFGTGSFATPFAATTFGVGPFGRTTAGLSALPFQSGVYNYGFHRRRGAALVPPPMVIVGGGGGGTGGGQNPINDPSIKDQFDALTRRLDKLTADVEKLTADVEKLKKNGSTTGSGVTVAPGLRPKELPAEEEARFKREHENKMLEIKKAYRVYSEAADALAKDPGNKDKQAAAKEAYDALNKLGFKP